METLKQANYASKIESVKNRIVGEHLNDNHTSLNLFFEKLGKQGEFTY